METRNLLESSYEELQKEQKKINLTLTARATLARIAKKIAEAGGAISEEDLANTTLGDFAIVAAQNSLTINVINTPKTSLKTSPQTPFHGGAPPESLPG